MASQWEFCPTNGWTLRSYSTLLKQAYPYALGAETDILQMIHNIPQPVFEQFITDVLARDPNVDLRKGVSFVSLEQVRQSNAGNNLIADWQTAGGVTTTVEERATGHQFQIRSKYLIGCDGARSKVRGFLGIESDGEDSCKFSAQGYKRA